MNGEFNYALDQKGRLFIPAKLRDSLGDIVVLSRGLDASIFVHSLEGWKRIEEKLAAMPISKARKLQLILFPSATRVELDSQGRVLVPQKLREYAGIEKNVVILGAGDRAEIWRDDKWTSFEESEVNDETLAAAMDEVGF